ncbi:MAG TPA: M20/M25/M40 family metallo-hydrolase [Blastocatellia bacterium]|nr:M20/M25/M40 family metallo-hydrolase [Blastocatellia bacterium]
MKKISFTLLSLILTGALAMPAGNAYAQRKGEKPTPAATPHGNADYIKAEQLKDYLYFVASDEMEGRDTPSRGLDTTAKFLAMTLSRWGLKPAGDEGTYFQRIMLRREKVVPAQTHAEINGQNFSYGDDFLAQPVNGTASGPLIYVGHGFMFKAKDVDAYKGIDAKDKIVVIAGSGLPKGVSFSDFKGKQGVDWEEPFTNAIKHGAKGIIFAASFQTMANWDRSRHLDLERGSISVEKFRTQGGTAIPAINASPKMLTALFQGEKESGSVVFNRAAAGDPVEPFDFVATKKVSFTVTTGAEQVGTQNVVAVLEGGDPVLKSEYVAIGAHYDHVGIGNPVDGDAIYNGADDDGSGTVSVLAIAEAFARGPRPKRSILFIWHCGEEKGLWGSRYFTENPTIPINQVITQLNIDMIGRTKTENDKPGNQPLPRPGEVFLIGSKLMSTELGEISEAVNKSYLNLAFNYRYDDPKDPNRFFYRSDHFNYARKGIPIIFYMDGEHEDYHRVTDSVEKIDYQNMEKIARTIYATAWELANRATRPRVDKPLADEVTKP